MTRTYALDAANVNARSVKMWLWIGASVDVYGGARREWYPRQDSNLRTRFRKPLLYPLSYGGVPSSIATARAELRGELFADFEADVFDDKVEALKSGESRDDDTRKLTAAAIDALESIVRRIRSTGARPVLVVPPCLDARAELISFARDRVDADVVAFNDPERFPILYDPANRFDAGHLNHAGAMVFSKLLAEARRGPLVDHELKEALEAGGAHPDEKRLHQ